VSDDESDSLSDWDEADMILCISPNVSVGQPHLQLLMTQGQVPVTAEQLTQILMLVEDLAAALR
jgi:hypothetical protein